MEKSGPPPSEQPHLELHKGDLLDKQYRVLRRLGEGKFGRCFLAQDRKDRQKYVLKVVRAVKRYVENSKIEAKILKELNDKELPTKKKRILKIYKQFPMDNNYVLVFERLGRSLKEELSRRTFSLLEIQDMGQQILQHRVIHTDLKLQNIMTEHVHRNLVKVIDYGNAVYSQERGDYVISTRQFRAPEVVLGLVWDYRADIWSLGCVLYQLATGTLLFPTHHNYHHLQLMQKRLTTSIPCQMAMHSLPHDLVSSFDKGVLKWPHDANPSLVTTTQNTSTLQDSITQYHSQDCLLPAFISALLQMLAVDPLQRPSASCLLKTPFFA